MLRVGHGLVRQACCLKALAKLHRNPTLDATEVGVATTFVSRMLCVTRTTLMTAREVYTHVVEAAKVNVSAKELYTVAIGVRRGFRKCYAMLLSNIHHFGDPSSATSLRIIVQVGARR